ncbi:MAG: hypothetical protein R3C58_06410 [Parvularculaceae bacterium]
MKPEMHGTTILSVRRNGLAVIGGDGQVSLGQTIVKAAHARKVLRRLAGGKGDCRFRRRDRRRLHAA